MRKNNHKGFPKPRGQQNAPIPPATPVKAKRLGVPRIVKDDSQDQVYPDHNPNPPHQR